MDSHTLDAVIIWQSVTVGKISHIVAPVVPFTLYKEYLPSYYCSLVFWFEKASLLNAEGYHMFQNRVNQSEMRVVCLLISLSFRVSSVTCLAGNNLHFRRVLKYEISQFLPNYYVMRA